MSLLHHKLERDMSKSLTYYLPSSFVAISPSVVLILLADVVQPVSPTVAVFSVALCVLSYLCSLDSFARPSIEVVALALVLVVYAVFSRDCWVSKVEVTVSAVVTA